MYKDKQLLSRHVSIPWKHLHMFIDHKKTPNLLELKLVERIIVSNNKHWTMSELWDNEFDLDIE